MTLRTISYLICLLTSSVLAFGQQLNYQDSNLRCTYEIFEGRFNGNYTSYYINGVKKSEGRFENNTRIGKWSVWDSTGTLRMRRVYENPFVFERLVPPVTNNKLVNLLNVPRYIPSKGPDGVNTYSYLHENNVYTTKRVWRRISAENNTPLFQNQRLISILYKNIENGNITAYSTDDDKFKKELTSIKIDSVKNKVIAYKTKEDWFFDKDRMISETRIIGICPIAIDQESKDTLELFWIYYPYLRAALAREKVNLKSAKVETLEDLFFYRHFTGIITKESNVYDREIADYAKGKEMETESERIEISIIELEHDAWLSFTRADATK